ncbi:MAG: hypothetical protein RSI32_06490 [Clostridia bacterium]
MKKSISIVLVVAVCVSMMNGALAKQGYHSIQEVREQVPKRWTQSYETKWRTIDIDVRPTVPDAEAMPVLKVEASYWQPEANGLDERWKSYQLGFFGYVCGDLVEDAKASKGKLKETFFTPPYDDEKAYLYESEFTLRDALDWLGQLLEEAKLTSVDFRIETPQFLSVSDYFNKKGELIAGVSNYGLEFSQHLHGIPILNHFYSGKERFPDGEPSLFPYLSVYCKSRDSALINGNFVIETEQLEEDIPLCSYSVIQTALEEEIASGRLRRVFDMDLGYVLFNEPGAIQTEETDYGMKLPVYAVPAWRVNCYAVKDGKTELRDDMGQDVMERGTREYGALIINAQTGEVYDRFGQPGHSADYAGFLSWKDVGGKL